MYIIMRNSIFRIINEVLLLSIILMCYLIYSVLIIAFTTLAIFFMHMEKIFE